MKIIIILPLPRPLYTCLSPLPVSPPRGTEPSAALLPVSGMLYHRTQKHQFIYTFQITSQNPSVQKLPSPPDANYYVCVITIFFLSFF